MTAYEKIYERAADNYGYIMTREVSELGVPKSEMSALAKRNRLVHKGYGTYRLATHYQPSEHDGYAEAVLLEGEGVIAWGESVLAMHDLMLVNPPVIEVATDRSQNRPHDLIDLQLIFSQAEPDLRLVKNMCVRLFAHRRRQPWPLEVAAGDDWNSDAMPRSTISLSCRRLTRWRK